MVTITNVNNPVTNDILTDIAYRWHRQYGDTPIPDGVTRYVAGFPVHPENIMPPAIGGDFELLCDDIAAKGQIDPAKLVDGMLLDGVQRGRACERAGVELWAEDYTLPDDMTAADYVLSMMARRNLTQGQRQILVSDLRALGLSHKQAIAAAGVSDKGGKNAVRVVNTADPAVTDTVRAGLASVNDAMAVMNLPENVQQSAAAELADGEATRLATTAAVTDYHAANAPETADCVVCGKRFDVDDMVSVEGETVCKGCDTAYADDSKPKTAHIGDTGGNWTCECGQLNAADIRYCIECDTERQAEPEPEPAGPIQWETPHGLGGAASVPEPVPAVERYGLVGEFDAVYPPQSWDVYCEECAGYHDMSGYCGCAIGISDGAHPDLLSMAEFGLTLVGDNDGVGVAPRLRGQLSDATDTIAMLRERVTRYGRAYRRQSANYANAQTEIDNLRAELALTQSALADCQTATAQPKRTRKPKQSK